MSTSTGQPSVENFVDDVILHGKPQYGVLLLRQTKTQSTDATTDRLTLIFDSKFNKIWGAIGNNTAFQSMRSSDTLALGRLINTATRGVLSPAFTYKFFPVKFSDGGNPNKAWDPTKVSPIQVPDKALALYYPHIQIGLVQEIISKTTSRVYGHQILATYHITGDNRVEYASRSTAKFTVDPTVLPNFTIDYSTIQINNNGIYDSTMNGGYIDLNSGYVDLGTKSISLVRLSSAYIKDDKQLSPTNPDHGGPKPDRQGPNTDLISKTITRATVEYSVILRQFIINR